MQQKMRELDKQLMEARAETCERARKYEVPMTLFPAAQPWVHFPWEGEFLPRSQCEDSLRQAIGLRELPSLEALIEASAGKGLSKKNSRVYFEAIELRDLLRAEAALTVLQAPPGEAPTPQMDCIARRRGESQSDSGGGGSALAVGEGEGGEGVDEGVSPALRRALEVFLEPVDTTVLATVPRHRPFAEVLDEHSKQWEDFIRPGEDSVRRAKILSVVSDSLGVSDIETEQCREQEQEKEQEAEQEQEIEMER